MKVPCKICEIINKQLKAFIIYEDEQFVSFLDIKPLFLGHALLVPRLHLHTIYDLPPHVGNEFLSVTQILGQAITQAMAAQGTFLAINNIVSQSIDHVHLHIVPRNKGDGLKGFFWPRTSYQNEQEMLEVQLAITRELKNVKKKRIDD